MKAETGQTGFWPETGDDPPLPVEFANRLTAPGYKTIFIDPDPTNEQAIEAYSKADFQAISHLEGKTDDVLLVQYKTNENELSQ